MSSKQADPKRIGIYSGTFDPIHKGHVAFARNAIDSAALDEVYIAIEAKPPRKSSVSHIGHRTRMAELATRPHPKINTVDLVDKYFLPAKTIPRLRQLFPRDQLILLIGSDLLLTMHNWPQADLLLKDMGLAVSVRNEHELAEVLDYIHNLPVTPLEIHIVQNDFPDASSRKIRHDIQQGTEPEHVLPSVYAYAKKEWLYDSIQ